jgi:hypothetical protein
MEIYTREFLQKYKQDFNEYSLAKQIVQQVLRQSQQGRTSYLHPIHISHKLYNNTESIIKFLRQMLPDSSVEYKTATRLDGTFESGIVIDWS